MDEENLFTSLYELRILVLQEQDDGKFRQVSLDKHQFKKVSDAVAVSVEKDPTLPPGYDRAWVRIKNSWELDGDLFIGLKSIYSDEEITEAEQDEGTDSV